MGKNILLINPWIHDFAAYDFWLKSLGLLYLGGLLRQNGHHVSYIDCLDAYHPEMLARELKPRRHAYGRGKFFRQVIPKPDKLKFLPKNYCRYGILPEILRNDLRKQQNADIVLVTSMMTYWYPGVFEAIRIIKEELPCVPVALGGKYATLCYEHAAKYSGADYIISGAGETQILELLEKLFGEKPTHLPDEDNLDSYPYPVFDLIGKIEQLPITTSRGCPYRCSYCSSHILNKKFLRRDPVKVADEIEHWQKNYGIINFSFYDDALLVEPDKMIIPLLAEIKKRNLTCQFHCPNGLHLREIDATLAKLLYTSGFKTIRFGFETADFQKQKETGGKVVNKELEDGVMYLKKAGYKTDDIGIYLLCGLPGQRASEVQESIDFVRACGAKPMLAEYSPIPNTKMWAEAVASSPFDIQAEPLYHNNSLLPCRNDDFTYDVYTKIKAALKNSM
ncbi:MAG TPA: radical SAM protein [Smithellaceae bacterium]|nr:radical SAM protein [Smithellaceae bacterium]HRS89169.1 radical SAM protein [Smithellaceae bacterium]HRV26093.1 radical SAM protein [Smithellaceae bacterium]